MAKIHTHYDNLKVARNAPPEVIRAAYKTLSQRFHPDRSGGSETATRTFQIINSAYEILSDPAKRREHDEWISRQEAEIEAAEQEAAMHAEPENAAGGPRAAFAGGQGGGVRYSRNPMKSVALSLRAQTSQQRKFTYSLCGAVAALVLLILVF